MTCTMYSVGHSTRSVDELADLLTATEVSLLVDIRSVPTSTRNPQFNRSPFSHALAARDVGYEWMGDSLGGLRPGGYEQWMGTPQFLRGLGELIALAKEATVAFMCAERLPDRCHRRFVARVLARNGHRVGHLLAPGETSWEPTPLGLPDP